MRTITLDWHHALYVGELDDKKAEFLDQKGGIYVWIFCGTPHRVCYVGTSRNFSDRFSDHLSSLLGGRYTVFGNMTTQHDFVAYVVEHYCLGNMTMTEINERKQIYIPTIHSVKTRSFTHAFADPETHINRWQFLNNLLFGFAEVTPVGAVDPREIEAALICGLVKGYEGNQVGSFQNKKDRRNATVLGGISKYPTSDFQLIHSGEAVHRLPKELRQISSADAAGQWCH